MQSFFIFSVLLFSHSIVNFSFHISFSEWHRGVCRVKLTKCDTGEKNEMKKAIMQVIYFRMAPLICCFLVILFYIEKKWLVIRNFATILPLNSKFFGKFWHFNANDGSVEMLRDNSISKISIKMKNFKTFYRAHTAINKIIQTPQDESFLRLWDKNFIMELYRSIETFVFYMLAECSS